MGTPPKRLEIVDALRGFAIVSIMLLHNIEHFDFYFLPPGLPEWLKAVDKGVWTSLFFLFGGKSYAIFALLFGLTFSLQAEGQAKRGKDFRGRFAWRLVLLACFGLVNSSLYQGDILMVYAILGFVLLPCATLGNGLVLGLAVLFLLQPYQWYLVVQGWLKPSQTVPNPESWALFDKSSAYLAKNSFVDTLWGNLTNGRHAVLLWTWETGRALQTCGLFLLGLLVGRLGLFSGEERLPLFRKLLVGALIAFVVLYPLSLWIPRGIATKSVSSPLATIVEGWSNFSFMLFLVASFAVLFWGTRLRRLQEVLSPVGRMSLSNYMIQSLLGTTVYYGFGLGLYRVTGATFSLVIGVLLAVMQTLFSRWWLARHKQGPLETLWHQATWVGEAR